MSITHLRRFCILAAPSLVPTGPALGKDREDSFDDRWQGHRSNLLGNATAQDFISLLPMTLTLEDYASTEKIAYLPRKLSTAGAPAGVDPGVGDIAYYAPWGNLAIFYKDAGYAKGLVKLGRFDSGVEALSVPGVLKVTIAAAGK